MARPKSTNNLSGGSRSLRDAVKAKGWIKQDFLKKMCAYDIPLRTTRTYYEGACTPPLEKKMLIAKILHISLEKVIGWWAPIKGNNNNGIKISEKNP